MADQQIVSLTSEIDQQLQAWATQAADGRPVAYNMEEFSRIKGRLMALQVRLAASPDAPTRDMAQRVKAIYDQYEAFRTELRRLSPERSPEFFIAEEKLLDSQLMGLNAYEATLKGGSGAAAAARSADARTASDPAR